MSFDFVILLYRLTSPPVGHFALHDIYGVIDRSPMERSAIAEVPGEYYG